MRRFHGYPLVLLIAVLGSFLPTAPLTARSVAQPSSTPITPPTPEQRKISPVTDPHLPSLTVGVAAANDTLSVGETTTLTITVTNQAPDPGRNLIVTLPTPDGTVPIPGAGVVSAAQGWRWTVDRLEGGATTTFAAQVRVVRMATGEALVGRVQAIADGLDLPIHGVGGALLVDRQRAPETAIFSPGQAVLLKSADGRIEVSLPADAAKKRLNLKHDREPEQQEPAPPSVVSFKRGMGAFFLHATDDQGQDVHQFAKPLTISVRYTPEQLEARGIAESNLSLFWFNPQSRPSGQWELISSIVDPKTQTVRAQVDHFSAFELSDGSSPSAAFIPSLQGWQVGLYSGSANYTFPIDVPAGPAGVKPELALTYSSTATDGDGGRNYWTQAGWVGRGWSLDTGSVALHKLPRNSGNTYSMVLNGQSFSFIRSEQLVSSPDQNNPTHWAWRPTDESFIRVRVIGNGQSTASRGGVDHGAAQPRYIWQVWSKDGKRYDFDDDLWWGWTACDGYGTMETYKWNLSRMTDPHGNTINYSYNRIATTLADSCNSHISGTVDTDSWPTQITWGGNLNTGATDRYKVEFVSSMRLNDTEHDWSPNQYGGRDRAPHETQQLDAIRVLSKSASSWDLVRQYNFDYNYSLYSDASVTNTSANTQYPKLTLNLITRLAKDGLTALPSTSFTYGTTRGTTFYPNGDWNRLISVNNGQGGTVSFAYENIGSIITNSRFLNNRRVKSKTITDGQGNSYTWTYTYGTAAYNSLGTDLGESLSTQQYPNSAVLYANSQYNPAQDNSGLLLQKPFKEFRGHDYVKEVNPNGGQTEHWFYQGDVGCTPRNSGNLVTSTAIWSNSCFLQMRDREMLKGREYRTVISGAANIGSPKLREIQHSFAVEFYDYYDPARLMGLWRAFTYESQTVETAWEGTTTPSSKTTKYFYDPSYNQSAGQYGNLSKVEEYDQTGALVRRTEHRYNTFITANSYIVDRSWADVLTNGQNQQLGLTVYFYDGQTTQQGITNRGLLTLSRKYNNVFDEADPTRPLRTDLTNVTIHSTDTSYAYDAYGNPTGITTYADEGTRVWNGSSNVFSAPGNGSAAYTKTTTYDSVFHTFPTQIDLHMVNVLLRETAGYDYRMGTLTSVTDVNGHTTNAQHDVFGRMTMLIKPGDTTAFPTTQAYYYDWQQPFRYLVAYREQAGSAEGGLQTTMYDGLGRQIQTKRESVNGTQNIVEDSVYDGLSNVTKTSQARYVNETVSTTFWTFTPRANDATMRWTTTTYDALNRPRFVTNPDSTRVEHRYDIYNSLRLHDLIDANRHRTQWRSDALGRLRETVEIGGDCGNYWGYTCSGTTTRPWAVYGTTTYQYSPLDLLTQVTDAKSNVTSVRYNSAGWKRQMTDPDMGTWGYTYDANGSLRVQTDAKGQTINFQYDPLGRLTAKIGSDGRTSNYAYDQASVSSGKGKQTSMSVSLNGTGQSYADWSYDARGRIVQHVVVAGGITRPVQYSYDSGDRMRTATYPTGEVVQYGYDAAWRPISLCTGNPCAGYYVSNAQYTALDQPQSRTAGNGTTQTWNYNNSMSRVSRITIGAGSSFDRSYTYDNTGNVTSINNLVAGQTETQTFWYDDLDRLTRAWTSTTSANPYDIIMGYDAIGNLLNKTDNLNSMFSKNYTYGANGNGTGAGPHQARNVAGWAYSYDANGNLQSRNGATFAWSTDNLPTTVTANGVTEAYDYDAAGERVVRSRSGVSTVYVAGMYEEDIQTNTKRVLYQFNGQIVGQRTYTSTSETLTYLYGDHLGSISLSTNEAGTSAATQNFTPWGEIRSGGISATTLNYTGQQRDNTGLLYYHARYYDPALSRFLSADSVVPGAADGSMQGVAIKPLTVDFHEPGFMGSVNKENQQQFWFQMSDQDRQEASAPWGPRNAQSLNRYSYVQNNPLRYTDPTGHDLYMTQAEAEAAAILLARASTDMGFLTAFTTAYAEGGVMAVILILEGAGYASMAAALSGSVGTAIFAFIAAVGIGVGTSYAASFQHLAWAIEDMNKGHNQGVALRYTSAGWTRDQMIVLDRSSGRAQSVYFAKFIRWGGDMPTAFWGPMDGGPIAAGDNPANGNCRFSPVVQVARSCK